MLKAIEFVHLVAASTIPIYSSASPYNSYTRLLICPSLASIWRWMAVFLADPGQQCALSCSYRICLTRETMRSDGAKLTGLNNSMTQNKRYLHQPSDIVSIIMMFEVHEPDFCNRDFINDDPISNMDATITREILRERFPNIGILQDFSNLFKSSFLQNCILLSQALKIFIKKR